MKKTKIKKLKKLLAIVGAAVFLLQQTGLVLAADPLTAADVVLAPNNTSPDVNSAASKGRLPTLEMTFDKSAIKNGETITATATPIGFAYDDTSLYYTWYLKHRNSSDDPNDWKIEAAKIMARGGFDRTGANYNSRAFGDSDKGYTAQPKWQLGQDQSQNCYLQDFKTGKIWEVSSSESAFNCPSGSQATCVQTRQFDIPETVCLADTQVPPGTITTTPKSACISGTQSDPTCTTTDSANFTSSISCETGYSPMCVRDSATLFPANVTDAAICNAFNLGTGNPTGLACSDSAITTSPVGPDGSTATDTLKCTRVRKANSCEHLFPDIDTGTLGDGRYTLAEEEAWGTNPAVKSTAGNSNNDEMNLVGLGNNTFTWTYQEGDEIGVVVEGMAQQGTQHNDATKMISWAFSKNTCPAFSDKIKNTPESSKQYYLDAQGNSQSGILNIDSFDPNDCLEDNLIDPAVAGIGNLDVSLTYDPQNPTNVPAETTGVNAGLSKGDVVTVTANVNNVTDPTGFYYRWTIEGRRNNAGLGGVDDNGWQDITSNFDDHTTLEGSGISKLSFKLNLTAAELLDTDDPKYIRVKLSVQESATGGGSSRSGAANAVIPVTSPRTGIEAYSTRMENGRPVLDQLICDLTEEPCVVAKNEIIGAVLPNEPNKAAFTAFNWKYNQDELTCDTAKIPGCRGNTVIFPVVGFSGDSFSINATAKAGTSDQGQGFSKNFAIVNPYAQIVPAANETNVSYKSLGLVSDASGNVAPTYSGSVLQTFSDTDITLQAVFYPSFIGKNTTYNWDIDGQKKDSQTDGTLALHTASQGTISNVSLNGTYVQSSEVRTALQNIWGISSADSSQQNIKASVQLEVPAGEAGSPGELDASLSGPGRFFASLAADLPSQAMFFVRIFLTMALLLLITGLLFAVIPGATETRQERA